MKKLLLFLFILPFWSCEKDETPGVQQGDITVTFDEVEYFTKQGVDITLAPTVEDAVNPVYSWSIDGKIVSTELSYTFVADVLGETYVTFDVLAKNGSASQEIRITVTDRDLPIIDMQDTYLAYIGQETEIVPEVEFTDETTQYTWFMNNEVICKDPIYKFTGNVANNLEVLLKVSNASGVSSHKFTILVMPEPIPTLFFDNGEYITPSELNDPSKMRRMSVCLGRNLVLAPVKMNMEGDVTYTWSVDGQQQRATGEYFDFRPEAKGEYIVTVTGKCTSGEATTRVKVECVDEEGTYMHKATEESKHWANSCFSYIPAPGQFINFQEGSTAEQARLSIHNLIKDQAYGNYVASLGAFGGYVIFGFDHSVENLDGADLNIGGNAFPGSNEPGVIWVMQDENGNGLPDDTWYELKGSETGKPTTHQRTTMTYFRPNADNADIIWMSNTGLTGSIDNNGYHNQRSYFPMFITEESYTLVGTLLPENPTDTGLEGNANFDWGYVDNINSKNGFYIEDAIQQDGSPANLKYIDFVKVHTGQQIKFAAIGEISTEPCAPQDLHIN